MTSNKHPLSIGSGLLNTLYAPLLFYARRNMGAKPYSALPTPVLRLFARWDIFIAPWMVCVPEAFTLPAEIHDRIYFLQPLHNTIELPSYGAECAPPPTYDAS